MVQPASARIGEQIVEQRVHAQDTVAAHTDDRPATGFRAEGKIYVVMLVSVTILAGLFIYLIRLDKKITKLENQSADTRRI